MSIESLFPLLVGLLELGAGIVYLLKRNYWPALTWLAYAVACVGLIKATK